MRLRAVLVALALALAPATARADTPPSVWDRARTPSAGDAYDLHRMVHQRLASVSLLSEEYAMPFKQVALERLKAEHVETGKNALLRFDLGIAYFEVKNYPRAAQILEAAIAEFPDHPMAEQVWVVLAFACGHVGDHVCERKAYREVLRRETVEPARVTPIMNLAETFMHLGDLREAIDTYREAIRISERLPPGWSQSTRALATWGLAVALDRSGDKIAAEREVLLALERSGNQPGLLRVKDVFFVPPYEVEFYEGLSFAARARIAKNARDALKLWRAAEHAFTNYVRAAEAARPIATANAKVTPEPERWLAVAKARLAEAKTLAERSQKLVPRDTPREPGQEFDL